MTFDDDSLRAEVRRRCDAAGSVRKWAKAQGLTDEQVRLFLTGARPAEPKLLEAMGLRRMVLYIPDPKVTPAPPPPEPEPAAPPPPPPENVPSAVQRKDGACSLFLISSGRNRFRVVKAVRPEMPELDLKQVVDLVSGAPTPLFEGLSHPQAMKLKTTLDRLGATTEIVEKKKGRSKRP